MKPSAPVTSVGERLMFLKQIFALDANEICVLLQVFQN
jgi:hypothetical protein